jgi:hypothetical protein
MSPTQPVVLSENPIRLGSRIVGWNHRMIADDVPVFRVIKLKDQTVGTTLVHHRDITTAAN